MKQFGVWIIALCGQKVGDQFLQRFSRSSFFLLFHCLPGFRCIKLCLIIVFHFLSCSKRRGKRSAKDRMCEKIPNSTLEGESLACKMNQYFLTEIVQKERHLIGRDLSLHEATCCTNWCMYWYCWKNEWFGILLKINFPRRNVKHLPQQLLFWTRS